MFYSANKYFKETFGSKVYKLALNGGMTCPNRDGTIGKGGCIFCSENGSGDFTPQPSGSINLQIEQAVKLVENKIKTNKYIAYFQSFTNTYAPTEYLERIFFEAINHPNIVALSVATRPDCLPQNVLVLLNRLNKIKPVFVELGLQTIYPKTAQYIRRGYPLSTFDTAVKNLKAINVNVIVHQILGLPKETPQMMIETSKYIAHSGANGIKLQLLHVLKGTDLAKDYAAGSFKTLSPEEYTDILCKCIEVLPPNMVVHRITGDGAKKLLIAPVWSSNKKAVLNAINKEFAERNIVQSSKYQTQYKFVSHAGM